MEPNFTKLMQILLACSLLAAGCGTAERTSGWLDDVDSAISKRNESGYLRRLAQASEFSSGHQPFNSEANVERMAWALVAEGARGTRWPDSEVSISPTARVLLKMLPESERVFALAYVEIVQLSVLDKGGYFQPLPKGRDIFGLAVVAKESSSELIRLAADKSLTPAHRVAALWILSCDESPSEHLKDVLISWMFDKTLHFQVVRGAHLAVARFSQSGNIEFVRQLASEDSAIRMGAVLALCTSNVTLSRETRAVVEEMSNDEALKSTVPGFLAKWLFIRETEGFGVEQEFAHSTVGPSQVCKWASGSMQG